MAEDVNASIGIDIDTSKAIAAIRQLSAEISAFHQLHSKKGSAVAKDLAAQTQNLTHLINRTGNYRASLTTVASATDTFTHALEKNKLTMGETMRYAMGSVKPFSRMFKSEWEMVSKVARERVKDVQTQYVKLGRDANGAVQAIKIRPLTLDMQNLGTQTMMAAQRMQILNKLVAQGSTSLLNWGKNTQWAGRQLMVGFTVPLTILGGVASKTFMDMEKQIIQIQRVYGDFSTSIEDTAKMTDALKGLALEFTKWGVSVTDTLKLAAEAAATGSMGADLINQVTNATKLAVLGNVAQAEALETTMSITSAFGIATEDLAKKIDFLNAVENQSVTSIQDLTTAIPIAAPVIKQLGGSVEDLAFFLTALKEGGVDAGEGANALKSGLASIINPSEKAAETLKSYGVNVREIVDANKGDVKGTVIELAKAFDTLDPLTRARGIEELFGKFQFSRISTLFQNVVKEGTQAERVLQLSRASTQELSILSQRELAKVEDSTTYKFEAAMQRFQAALAPVGEQFLKAVTPLLDFGTSLLEQFNKWDDGAKTFAVTLTSVVAGIGPVLLMTIGLMANGVANLIKLFQFVANTIFGVGKNTKVLGMETNYMTRDMIEAQAAAASLSQVHSNLTQVYTSEAAALAKLAAALERAAIAQRGMGGSGPVVGRSAGRKKYASGVVSVPGPKGAGDVVPAMLAPGEAVIPAAMAKKYAPLIQGMVAGSIPGYKRGREGTDKAHLQGNLDPNDPKVLEQILSLVPGWSSMSAESRSATTFQGGLVAELPSWINQDMKSGSKGVNPNDFESVWEAIDDKTLASAVAGGLDPKDPAARKALAEIESQIGKRAADLARKAGVTVTDTILEQATSEVLKESEQVKGKKAGVVKNLRTAAAKVSSRRTGLGADRIRSGLGSGEYALQRTTYGGYETANIVEKSSGEKVSRLDPTTEYRKRAAEEARKQGLSQSKESGLARQLMLRDLDAGRISVSDKGFGVKGGGSTTEFTGGHASRPIMSTVRDQAALDRAENVRIKSYGKSFGRRQTDQFIAGLEEAAQTASPSKRTRKVAKDTVDGYVGGLEEGKSKVAKTGSQTGAAGVGNITQSGGQYYSVDANGKKTRVSNAQGAAAMAAQSARERRSEAARQGWETRRANAGAQQPAASGRNTLGGFRGVGSLALSGAMLMGPVTDAINGQMPDLMTTIFGAMAGVDAIQTIKTMRADSLAKAGGKAGTGIASKAMAGLSSMMGNITGLFGKVALGLVRFIPVIGWVVTGLTVLYTLYDMHQKALEKARQEGFDFANTLSSTNEKLQGLAEAAGTVTASEEARAKEIARLSGTEGTEVSGFGKSYLESDAGKTMAEDVKKSLDSGMSKSQMGAALGLQLAEAVAQGAIDGVQATSVAGELAKQLGDSSIAISAIAELNKIVGPNGEDLAKDPLEVTLALTQATATQFENIRGDIIGAETTKVSQAPKPISARGGRRFATANDNPMGPQGVSIYMNEEIMAAQAAFGIQAVAQGQRMLDVLNEQYDTQVEGIQAALAITTDTESRKILEQQISDIQNERQASLDAQVAANKEIRKDVEQTLLNEQFSQTVRDEAFKGMVNDLYEGDSVMQTLAKAAMETAQSMKDVDTIDVQLQLASGMLDPASAQSLLTMMADPNNAAMAANYSLIIDQQGDAAAAELMKSLLGGGADAQTVTATLNLVANGGDIQQVTAATQAMTRLESLTGNKELVNTDNLEKAQESMEKITKYQGKLTKEVLMDFGMTAESAQTLLEIDGFSALPDEDQKKFAAQFDMVMDLEGQLGEAYMAWGGPLRGTFADYAATIVGSSISGGATGGAATVSATKQESYSGGGGGGAPEKTADEIELENLNFILGKRQKALDIISMKEDEINEKYDKRKEALDKIAEINSRIAQEQRSQLDLASALASGDIAAAARAAQTMREQSSTNAAADQQKALEDARDAELSRVSFDGVNRDALEAQIKNLEMQIAEIEYRQPKKEESSGGGGGGGGTRTVDVEMPNWTPDGMQAGGTWTIQNGMWVYTPPGALNAGNNIGGNPANQLSSAPVAPVYVGQTADNWERLTNAYKTANEQWISQTYNAVEQLKLSGSQFTTLGTNTDALKAKIVAMGGVITSDGMVKIGGITTSLSSMSDELKKIGPNVTKAADDAAKAVFSTGGTADAAERAATAAANAAAGAATSAGKAGESAKGAAEASKVATGSLSLATWAGRWGYLARKAGGLITGPGTGTSDSIPTMLSNGEYVVKASSVAKIGVPALEAINAGRIPEITGANVSVNGANINSGKTSIKGGINSAGDSGSVYNYSVTVNAQSNANADQIANAVMTKIKQVDGQRIRGVVR